MNIALLKCWLNTCGSILAIALSGYKVIDSILCSIVIAIKGGL